MPKLSLAVLPYMQAQHFVECDGIPGARTLSSVPLSVSSSEMGVLEDISKLCIRSLAFGRFLFVGFQEEETDADSCGRLISDPFSVNFREIFSAIRKAGLAGCRAQLVTRFHRTVVRTRRRIRDRR